MLHLYRLFYKLHIIEYTSNHLLRFIMLSEDQCQNSDDLHQSL